MPSRCSGEKVKARLIEMKMTSGKLVELTGLSAATINRVLHNTQKSTSDYTLQKIADALQCSPYDLLRDEAVEEAILEETVRAVSEVVSEAVAEAVQVVTDEIAPEVPNDVVAENIPPLPVVPPAVLDVPTYVKDIMLTTEARVAELRRGRNLWACVAITLFVVLLALAYYFVWEILHPDQGLTRILFEVYGG